MKSIIITIFAPMFALLVIASASIRSHAEQISYYYECQFLSQGHAEGYCLYPSVNGRGRFYWVYIQNQSLSQNDANNLLGTCVLAPSARDYCNKAESQPGKILACNTENLGRIIGPQSL